jgi:hypothetical protein
MKCFGTGMDIYTEFGIVWFGFGGHMVSSWPHQENRQNRDDHN